MKRISEKLQINKQTPPTPDNTIVNFCCIIWGFLPLDRIPKTDKPAQQCIDIVNEWIGKYNITKVSKAIYCGENASQGYFKALQEHVQQYLGDKVLKKFFYTDDYLDELDVWKTGKKKKIKGTDNIYIVYNEKEIAIISDKDYKEARIIIS